MAKKKKKKAAKAAGNFMNEFIETSDRATAAFHVPHNVFPPGWEVCDEDEMASPAKLMFGPLIVKGAVSKEFYGHEAQQGEWDAPLFRVVWTMHEEGEELVKFGDAETVREAYKVADEARGSGGERIRRFQIRGAWMDNLIQLPWGSIVLPGPPRPSHVPASRELALWHYETLRDGHLPDEHDIGYLREAEIRFKGKHRDILEKLLHADRLLNMVLEWKDATTGSRWSGPVVEGATTGQLWFMGEDGIPEEAGAAGKRLLRSVIEDRRIRAEDHPARLFAEGRIHCFDKYRE